MKVDLKRKKRKKQVVNVNQIFKNRKDDIYLMAIGVLALALLLMYLNPPTPAFVEDANTLDGFDSKYFATKDELNNIPVSTGGGGGSGSQHVTTIDDTDWNETNSDWIALNNASYTMVRIGGDDIPTKNLTIDSGDLNTEAFILLRLGSSNRFLKMGNDGSDDSIISWDDNDDLVFLTYPTDSSELGGDEILRFTSDGKVQQTNGGVTWDMYVNATGVLVWEMSP